MSSIPVESVHHIEDVGQLLLSAQRDLARVRQRLEALPLESNGVGGGDGGGGGGLASDALDALRELLNHTESNLRVKAEAVLRSVEDNKLNTLPAVTAQPLRFQGDFYLADVLVQPEHSAPARAARGSMGAQGAGGVGPQSPLGRKHAALSASHAAYLRRPVGERMAEARNMELLSRPLEGALPGGAHANGAREYIQNRFLVPQPTQGAFTSSVSADTGTGAGAGAGAGTRPIERYGRNWRDSKVMKGSRLQPHILPRTFRKNPKLFPPISAHDSQQGILQLVERGYIPPFIDVSAAFVSTPAPLQQAPATFHHHADQFRRDRQQVATAAAFNLAQVKLDLGAAILDHNLNDYERSRLRQERQLLLEPPQQQLPAQSQKQIAAEGGAPLAPVQFAFPQLMPPDPAEQARERALALPTQEEDDALFADLLRDSGHLEPGAGGEEDGEGGALVAVSDGGGGGSGGALVVAGDARARDYDELLDTYSLHQFLIRKGKTLTSTPEFLSFQRLHAHAWGQAKCVIGALEKVCKDYRISCATVRGARVMELAEDELAKLTPEKLFSCFVINTAPTGGGGGGAATDPILLQLLLAPAAARYKMGGDVARALAALKVQSTWRMFLQRRLYVHFRWRHTKAIRIQRAWRRFLTLQETRRRIAERWAEKLARWRTMQAAWKKNWGSFSSKKRVHLHVPSISTEPYQRQSLFNFAVRENAQLSRLCELADPLVDVLYVAPFHLSSDVQNYYLKLLAVGGVANVSSRVKLLVAENAARFPEHFSLAKQALYSPKLLRKIRDTLHGRPCVLVPGEVGLEDLQLAVELHLPLLGAEPEVHALFGSKSGSKRIFAAAEVSVAPGAHDIYDEADLYAYLAKLIVDQLHVARWLLKIDNESGGRGLACVDTAHFKVVAALREEKASHASRWNLPEVLATAQERVAVALKKSLPRKVVLATPTLYDSRWANFAAAFFRVGGVIEAAPPCVLGSPSVNLLIEPDGSVSLLNSHDQVFSSAFVFAGANFPSSAPADLIHPPALAIGRQCAREGVLGYVGIDFVAWTDGAPGAAPKLWAVDLNLRTTATQASFALFHFLLKGRYVYSSGGGMKDVPVHLRPPARYLVPCTPLPLPVPASSPSRSGSRSGLSASGATSPSARMFASPPSTAASSVAGSRDNSRPSSARRSAGTPKLPGIGGGGVSGANGSSDAKRGGGSASSATAAGGAVAEEERFYSSVPYLYQPHLATVQFSSFFHLCRLRGISFDVRARVGTVFTMMDSLASGSLGLLCVGLAAPPATAATVGLTPRHAPSSPLHAMQTLVHALLFLEEQVSTLRFGAHLYDAESNLTQMLLAFKGLTKAQREANHMLLLEQNAQISMAPQTQQADNGNTF